MIHRLLRLVLACGLLAIPAGQALGVTGDVNADGTIGLADALALCRQLSGEGGPVADPSAADVNDDGTVDDTDVQLLMLAALGEPLPVRTFTVVPNQLDFLNVLVDDSQDGVVTVTSTGTLPLSVDSIALGAGSSAEFSLVAPPGTPAVLGQGEFVEITVRYMPVDTGTDTGSLELLTDGGNVSIPLLGLGISPQLEVSPTTIDFGDQPVGQPVQQTLTISNVGSAPLTIQSVAPGTGTSPDFSVGAPATLLVPAGDATTVDVGYTPAEAGNDSGSIDVLTDGGNANVPLSGRGVEPVLSLVPDSLAFGNVLVGDAPEMIFEIFNTGSAPLTVNQVAPQLGTSSAFSLGTFPATPFAVLPGESQAISVTFSPGDVGPAGGAIEVDTNAGDGMVALTGAGVQPEISLNPTTADFGNVMVGEGTTVDILISNTGTATLNIDSIVLAAGTSGDFALDVVPATPLALAPGASPETVTISYMPGEVGPDSGTLEIASNDPDTPVAMVPLTGNGVATEFVLQPASLNFSNVPVNATSDLQFEILNSGSTELTVLTVDLASGSDPSFAVPSPPVLPQTLPVGGNLAVTVRFGPTTSGVVTGAVDVDTSAGPGSVPLQGNGIAPAIQVSPTSLDFGTLPVGGMANLILTIENVGSDTLNLASIGPGPGADPEFSIPTPPTLPAGIGVGGNLMVTVSFSPTTAGDFGGTIRIASDDPAQSVLDVPLNGSATGGAFLVASPTSVDFGDVPVAVQADVDVTLTNTGDTALTILSVGLQAGTSAEFSVGAPGDTTLGPGESTMVQTSYLPVDAGTDLGAVEISTDANTVSVPLSGNGTVEVTPVALNLNVTSETLVVDDCLQLRGTVEFSDGSFSTLTSEIAWSSDAENVAAVDADGLVLAAEPGAATITASFGVLVAQAVLTVDPAGSVRVLLPCGDQPAGASFTAELVADTGALPLGAYAIRVLFDPAHVVITGVAGGTGATFSATPFVNASGFTGGDTLLAAYQATSLSAPTGVVSLARIDFQVTGAAGAVGSIDVAVVELIGTDLMDIAHTTTPSRIAVQP